MNNVLLAISGFTVGYVIEAVLAVVFVILMMTAGRGRKTKEEHTADAGAQTAPAESETREDVQTLQQAEAEESAAQAEAAATDTVAEQIDLEGKTVFDAKIKSFDEAYAELSREQAGFFRHIKEYALQKPNSEEKKQSSCICVKSGGKQLVKLTIRRGITVAQFLLENDLLKEYKRQGNSAAIKVKATEVPVYDVDAMNTACRMVDLMEEQNERERQAAKERKKAARKEKAAD